MILNDNDPILDGDLVEIMEGLLCEHLARYDEDQWFKLRDLYAKLEIKCTLRKTGSLDKIILRTLDEWNWKRHVSEYFGVSFVRRNRPTEPVTITLVDGTTRVTNHSWPPYLLPAPTPEQAALFVDTRARL